MTTLTVAVATLSVNTLKMKVVNIHTKIIVSTLTVAVATISTVNTLEMKVVNIYIKNYRVDTKGCSSNAWCKHVKRMFLLG